MFTLAFGQPLQGGLTLSCRPQPLLNTRLDGEDQSPGHEMTCRRAFLHAIYQEREYFLSACPVETLAQHATTKDDC